MKNESSTRRDVTFWILRAFIAGALLWWAFANIDLGRLSDALESAEWAMVAAAGFATMAFTALVAMRLAFLLERASMPIAFGRVWVVNLAAQFYGLFVPGGSVSQFLIRYSKFARHSERRRALAARMIVDRIAGLVAVAAIGITAWAIDVGLPSLAVAVAVATAAVVFAPQLAVFRPAGDNPGLDSLRSKLQWTDLPWLTGLALLAQVPAIIAYFWLARSIDIDLSVVTLTWVRSGALVAAAVPISISGLGIREGVLLVVLSGRGIDEPTALAFGVIVFGATILVPAAVGGLSEIVRLVTPEK